MAETTAPNLADWLLSRGRTSVTTAQAADLLGVSTSQVRVRLRQPVLDHLLFTPCRGLWVAIPPEFRTWGVTPATHFLDAFMNHIGRQYYIGWLSAAELYGAAHQRPQVTQVAVNRPVANREVSRVRLRFHTRAHPDSLPRQRHQVPTGQVWASTPELTAIDLADHPDRGSGLSNVATILSELAEDPGLSGNDLAELAPRFPGAAARRLGYLLKSVDANVDLKPLLELTRLEPLARPAVLSTWGPRRGAHDRTWDLLINSDVDPDL